MLAKDPEFFKKGKDEVVTDDYQQLQAMCVKVGMRCQIEGTEKRGVIKYIGKVPEMDKGFYVGIALDEPEGDNNGSIDQVAYFDCNLNHGMFLRPTEV